MITRHGLIFAAPFCIISNQSMAQDAPARTDCFAVINPAMVTLLWQAMAVTWRIRHQCHCWVWAIGVCWRPT
jgi:hypothetical protein